MKRLYPIPHMFQAFLCHFFIILCCFSSAYNLFLLLKFKYKRSFDFYFYLYF